MVEALDWIGRAAAHDGVVEREFRLSRTAGTVPGALWMPPTAGANPPLVLLGHGGSGHKQSDRIVSLPSPSCGQLAPWPGWLEVQRGDSSATCGSAPMPAAPGSVMISPMPGTTGRQPRK